MPKQHINIRVTCCAECPLAELSLNENSRIPTMAFVKCTELRKDVGSIEVAIKGISEQCPHPKITDVKDILED